MRKLAREAVIFMLAGLLLASVGPFIYLCRGEAQNIQTQRNALKEECGTLRKTPGVLIKRISDGLITTRTECDLVFGKSSSETPYD